MDRLFRIACFVLLAFIVAFSAQVVLAEEEEEDDGCDHGEQMTFMIGVLQWNGEKWVTAAGHLTEAGYHFPAGEPLRFHASGYDYDVCVLYPGGGAGHEAVELCSGWLGNWEGTPEEGYEGVYDIEGRDGGQSYTISVTATDVPPHPLAETICDDDDVTDEVTVNWVGVDEIDGPEELCCGEIGVYSVTADPIGDPPGQFLPWITWEISPGYQGSPTDGIRWHTPGTKTIKATIGTSSKDFTVEVLDVPDCEVNACSANGGGGDGGCSGASCGVSIPMPDFGRPVVTNLGLFGLLGPGFQPCGPIEVSMCESPPIVTYASGCGCWSVSFDDAIPKEQDPRYVGGYKITRLANNSAESGFLVEDPWGNKTVFGPPDCILPECKLRKCPIVKYITADGLVTDYYYQDGRVTEVTMPDVRTWTYSYTDENVEVEAPDGTSSLLEYSNGQLTAASLFVPGQSEPAEKSEYGYDGQGRLISFTKDKLLVTYDYGESSITVTQKSADDPLLENFSETVYEYGETTTTITRKHPSDPAKDQVTVYEYFTKTKVYYYGLEGEYSIVYKTYPYKVTDPMGNTVTYSRYVSYETDTVNPAPGDYIRTEEQHMFGKVFKTKDSLGRETYYNYDVSTGLLESVVYPEVDQETYEEVYDYEPGTHWLRTTKNVRGNFTHYVRPPSAMHRVSAVKISEPDSNGNEPADWTAIAPIRTYEYYDDPIVDELQLGRVKTESVPDIEGQTPHVRTYGYLTDLGGGVFRPEPGPTAVTYKYWDGQAYVDKTEYTTYGIGGQALNTEDAGGRTISYEYDEQGRQTRTVYAAGVFTESSYGCCGLEWTKDEDGRYAYYEYDDAGRVTDVYTNESSQSPATPLVHYEYDCFGNAASVTTFSAGGVGRMTAYAYDKNNRVVEIIHPSPLGTEQFGYDEVGNLQWKKDGDNAVTLHKYDALNRLTDVYYNYAGSLENIVYPQDADVSYTYHGGSRLRATMTDSVGTSEYEYDEQDRLISYTPPAPSGHASVEYAYNNLGQKTEVSTTGLGLTYEYFANGWLKAVRLGNDMIAEYEYDEVGNRTGINLGNGTHTVYDYDNDPRYRVSGIGHYNGQTLLGSIAYPNRDGSGNPLSMVDSSGQTAYDYDNNSRLTSAGVASYSYDWVGNRLVPGSPQYNNADQLTSGFGHTYNYDGRGNMIESVGANGKTFAYTPANLLESVTHAGVQDPSVMTWDGDSNRVSFSSSTGGTWQFVYDPTAGIPAVIVEVTPSGNVYYIREPNGALIARVEGENIHYYHFDALGSTRLLTDDSGAVTDEYSYDAWGNLLGHTGSTQQPYQFVGQLGYYTHWQDENLGPLQLGVRFYDPESGRFTQVDPVPVDRRSGYDYAGNCPPAWADPGGKARTKTTNKGKTIPIFLFEPSCNAYQPALAYNVLEAYKHISDVIDGWSLNCPGSIRIKCNDKCEWWPRVSGWGVPNIFGFGDYMIIYYHSQSWPVYCTILHELQHICPGDGSAGLGHKGDKVSVPGCGDLNR